MHKVISVVVWMNQSGDQVVGRNISREAEYAAGLESVVIRQFAESGDGMKDRWLRSEPQDDKKQGKA
jgi:hypothetical protein